MKERKTQGKKRIVLSNKDLNTRERVLKCKEVNGRRSNSILLRKPRRMRRKELSILRTKKFAKRRRELKLRRPR